MEQTVNKFYYALLEMQEGGRLYWRALAQKLDDECEDCEEAAEWLKQISDGDEI